MKASSVVKYRYGAIRTAVSAIRSTTSRTLEA
jgi:hypothetical protein